MARVVRVRRFVAEPRASIMENPLVSPVVDRQRGTAGFYRKPQAARSRPAVRPRLQRPLPQPPPLTGECETRAGTGSSVRRLNAATRSSADGGSTTRRDDGGGKRASRERSGGDGEKKGIPGTTRRGAAPPCHDGCSRPHSAAETPATPRRDKDSTRPAAAGSDVGSREVVPGEQQRQPPRAGQRVGEGRPRD